MKQAFSPHPSLLLTSPESAISIPMKKITTTLCLTIAVLLGSMGMSASAEFSKGLDAALSGDFTTALREWKPLAEKGDAVSQTF